MSEYTPPEFKPGGYFNQTNLSNLTKIASRGTVSDFKNYYDLILDNNQKNIEDWQKNGLNAEDRNRITDPFSLTTEELKTLEDLFEQRKAGPISDIADDVLDSLGLNKANVSSTFKGSEYLPNKVAGNVLDNFDSSTYKLRLLMKDKGKGAIDNRNLNQRLQDQDDSEKQYNRKEQNRRLYRPGAEDIIIIAETGSTDINIDNVVVTYYADKPTGVNFTLTEPGAITLLDRLGATRHACGYEGTDNPLILEVEFKGYTADPDDEDAGGKPKVISGPYFFPLGGVKFSMDITTEGGVYDFTSNLLSDTGLYDVNYRIPKGFKISGRTIRELLNEGDLSLESIWNKKLKEIAEKNGTKPDSIIIDLDELIQKTETSRTNVDDETKESTVTPPNVNLLKDSLFKNPILKEDFAQRFPGGAYAFLDGMENESQEISEPESVLADGPMLEIEALNGSEIMPEDGLSPTVIKGLSIKENSNIFISLPDKESFSDILATVLSLSEDLFTKASRLLDPNDPNSQVDTKQAFVTWYKVIPDVVVDYNNFDKKRNEYVKTFIFKPVLIKTSKTSVGVSMKELNEGFNLSLEDVKSRLKELNISKEYFYMFTGKNDQVIDFNLRFDEAFALEVPSYGEGSFADQSGMATANSLQETESSKNVQTESPVTQEAKKGNSVRGILDSFKELKNNLGDFGFNSLLTEFGDYIGFTDAEIKSISGDLDGDLSKKLAESLADEKIASALANNELVKKTTAPQTDVSTESDESEDEDSINSSGYVDFLYSSELIKGLEGDGDASQGRPDEADARTSILNNVRNNTPTIKASQPSNKVSNAPSERGSFRQSMFSSLMDSHGKQKSDKLITLTVRGDPWWLGKENLYEDSVYENEADKPRTGISNELGTTIYGNSYDDANTDFLLVLESPRKFDFNIDDEDQNTGLYDYSGINYTMSGVYETLRTSLSFSAGLFTVELYGAKNNAYDMSVIDSIKDEINTQYTEKEFERKREEEARSLKEYDPGDYGTQNMEDYVDSLATDYAPRRGSELINSKGNNF